MTRDKYLVHDEYKRLLYVARTRPHLNAKRDLAMWAVGGLTGVRVAELTSMRFEDLTLAAEPPFAKIQRRKKKKPTIHDVVLPPTAHKALLAYVRSIPEADKAPAARVFAMTTRQAGRLFKHYCQLAGLSSKYSIHALRHYRGLSLYEQTHDIELVREALGHSNLASTQIYVHTLDHAKKTVAVDIDLGDDAW